MTHIARASGSTSTQPLLASFAERKEPANGVNGTSFYDPAFAVNKTRPIHRWVPWIAGFASEFVKDVIRRNLPEAGLVMDPFAGVGTTLVEAMLLGYDAIGFEINPYAAMACRVKLSAVMADPVVVNRAVSAFQDFYHDQVSSDYVAHRKPPKGFKSRVPFFSPPVLRKVLIVLDYIDSISNAIIRDLFRLAFASTMVRYSNYSYEPSLGTRQGAGKSDILDYPVDESIVGKLREMSEDIEWARHVLGDRRPRARVFNESFFDAHTHAELGSIDLVVTSPPYLNNYHYNRNTRPQLYWLDLVKCSQEMKPLEQMNFGKFWQTVRDQSSIELNFPLEHCELADILELLRSTNRERGVYGGAGWANYVAAYFNDCYRFVTILYSLLSRNGNAYVVIGNSIIQGVPIPTDRFLAQIADSVGFHVVGIEVPRSKRTGNSIIHSDVRVAKAAEAHQLYEAVVHLRKR